MRFASSNKEINKLAYAHHCTGIEQICKVERGIEPYYQIIYIVSLVGSMIVIYGPLPTHSSRSSMFELVYVIKYHV